MKSKKNRVLILLISILIMAYTLNSDIINNFQSPNQDFVINQEDTFGIEALKKAGFWDENDVSYIHISADNWSATNLPWIQNRTGSWSDPHLIENITIDGTGRSYGILIENSNDYFIIRNVTIYNTDTVTDWDAALKLDTSNNGRIIGNKFSDNENGIILWSSSNNNTITKNHVFDNLGYGIFIYNNSDKNTISSNKVYTNSKFGISIERNSDNNSVLENTVYLNTWAGICIIGGTGGLTPSYNNVIYGNWIQNNTDRGIDLRKYVYSTNVSRNVIINNDLSGIALRINYVSDNVIWGNLIKNNKQFGVNIAIGTASNNLIYQNSFIGNVISHGNDIGSGNNWNNTIMGNYWDNHTSPDSDNDGIVDVPYTWITGSASSVDYFPLTESPVPDGEKIHIDDSGISALNWSVTSKLKLWCKGSGTFLDPYFINNLEIDAGGSGTGILIGNSSAYFIIQNSTVYNAGSNPLDAGIKLEESINGKIVNNNCSNNNYGIVLNLNCDNNTLSGNIVNENSLLGINLLNDCNKNLISRNTVNNLGYGIYLVDNCDENIISRNTANNNIFDGIHLEDNSHGNKILGNTVNDNNQLGIYIYNNCNNNTISENNASNTITSNQLTGILLDGYCINNTISRNNAKFNFNYGIALTLECDNNIVSANNANDNVIYGINIWSCNNNTISGNNASNLATSEQDCGIRLSSSSDNIISENFSFNNTEYGIIIDGGCDKNLITENYLYFNTLAAIRVNSIDCDNNIVNKNIVVSPDWKFIIDNGNSTAVNLNYFSNNFPSFDIEIITQLFSTTEFVITIKISCEITGSGVSPNFIEIQWNETVVSSNNITELGNGLYNITLSPIFVESGGNPILLNMTLAAPLHKDKYYETELAVEYCMAMDLIHIDIMNELFTKKEFIITFSVHNWENQGITDADIRMWWGGVNVSLNVLEIGNGLYNITLTPIFTDYGEDPVLLNMTVKAIGYTDKYYETHISVEPDSEPVPVPKLLYLDILSQIFSIEEFNITFFVFNESKHGIGSGTIQMWWNGSDVSSHIQNLGNGFYFVSLEPLTVKPGEEPIILEIAISTSEYEDFSFETYISVDPDTLIEDDIIPSEFPFFLIIIIITSIASGIGITGTILFLLRRRKGVSEVINTNEP